MVECQRIFRGACMVFGLGSYAIGASNRFKLTEHVCSHAINNIAFIASDSQRQILQSACLESNISELEPDVVLPQENSTCKRLLIEHLFDWISTFTAYAHRDAAGICEVLK